MNTRGLRGLPSNGHRRRKVALDLDLNNVPPSESRDQAGTSSRAGLQAGQDSQQDGAPSPALIDVDAIEVEDEVLLSSPRAFAEAKNNSRRQRVRAVVVDVELGNSEGRTTRSAVGNRNKRRRIPSNQTIINCEQYINLEYSSNSKKENTKKPTEQPPPPPPPPPEPTFSCPICMGPLVEEMSTKCGHIFCKTCIKAAIAAQTKCPTCRKRVTTKDIIRIYLPATATC